MRRRDVVVAAGALALARPAVAAAQIGREADALTRALRLEHATVFAYDAVDAAGALRGDAALLLRRLRGHEAEHAEALARALTDIAWPLPRPPDTAEEVDVPQIRAALGGLGDRAGALAFLREIERLSVGAHRAALGRLRDGRHLQLVATILAAEATHQVAWRAVG